MDLTTLKDGIQKITKLTQDLLAETSNLYQSIAQEACVSDPFVMGLTIFVLSCFLGYYVIWRVTPSLHSPLMAVTNAISSVIIVGAIIAAGPDVSEIASGLGLVAVFLASINIFGGFMITERMLSMFNQKNQGE
jgi:NAD(P) transhydrogenase subunit alpha